MTEKMWHFIVVSLCLLSYDFMQPVRADDLLCNVTQDDRGTVYSVPEFEAENCGYSWANPEHVLANHKETMEGIVVTNSNRTLVTHDCYNLIHYTRDCISEGSQLTATCMSNCTRNVAPDDQGILIYVIPISAVAGIVVLLGLCLLCWKFKDRICCCNGTIGVCFTVEKTLDHPPNTSEEATGLTGTQQMTSAV